MPRDVDLSDAKVACALSRKPGPKAVEMLLGEVKRRSGVVLESVEDQSDAEVVLSSTDSGPAEGFRIEVDASGTVSVLGNDPRGLLYGTGKLLRVLQYSPGGVGLSAEYAEESHPRYKMRGHQLGFRRSNNTYDSWGIPEYEQYIRDLVAWGINSIELIPPVTSPDVINRFEFGAKALRMNLALSELLDTYDLDVHIWLPANDRVIPGQEAEGLPPGTRLCPSTEVGRRLILEARRRLFEVMRRIDAVFIPGGDPGGCECPRCEPWVETMVGLAEDIHRELSVKHPEAKIWLSNQGFLDEDSERLYNYIAAERPPWLGGLVYGPWVPQPVWKVRRKLKDGYDLRGYPDICHSVRCQFPVPDWDPAYALIEGREVPNPRPRDFKVIHSLYSSHLIGNICYSDGVNDDTNKFLVSALDWDPGLSPEEALLDYSSYLMDAGMAERITEGILALEGNWRGSLNDLTRIERTLGMWREMESDAGPELLRNWRFQLCLLRAYLDAYVGRKLRADREAENEVLTALRGAEPGELPGLIKRCRQTLIGNRGDPKLRGRIEELAGDMNESIGMKLGSKYGANPERADILDHLDQPLNNSEWLLDQLNEMGPGAGLDLGRILDWEDPGTGGFYDDLGNPDRQPHLVRRRAWEEDPQGLETASQEFDFRSMREGRLSWRRMAMALWGAPLEMHYGGLDPSAAYRLRVTYGGFRRKSALRLRTGNGNLLHDTILLPKRSTQFEFDIPSAATDGGELDLVWEMVREEGVKRGIAVAEAWLIRRA